MKVYKHERFSYKNIKYSIDLLRFKSIFLSIMHIADTYGIDNISMGKIRFYILKYPMSYIDLKESLYRGYQINIIVPKFMSSNTVPLTTLNIKLGTKSSYKSTRKFRED